MYIYYIIILYYSIYYTLGPPIRQRVGCAVLEYAGVGDSSDTVLIHLFSWCDNIYLLDCLRDTIEETSFIFCEAVMADCVHPLGSSLCSLDVAKSSLLDMVVDLQLRVQT